MAKQSRGQEKAGRVKIRLVEFEVEGNDQSIQESLKSIAVALNRGAPSSAARPIYIASGGGSDQEFEEDDLEEGDDESVIESTATRVARAPKKPPTPNILDINFTDVSPTLKEFVAEKNPRQLLQKYLVVAYWYKHTRGISDLTQDHFFTAFRHLQWTVPKDPQGPIRDLRHKRRTQMGAGSTPGTSTINHIGENIVLEMKNGAE